MWTERSIHMLQLATQLLNHPGTSREAGFLTLPPGVTRISMTSARLLLCDNHFMQQLLLVVCISHSRVCMHAYIRAVTYAMQPGALALQCKIVEQSTLESQPQ